MSQVRRTGRWCLVTSRPRWAQFAQEGMWLFDRADRLSKVRPGDQAVVYLTKEGGGSAYGGTVAFQSRDVAAHEGAGFGYAARIKVLLQAVPPLPVNEVRQQLVHLPKHARWGSALQGRVLIAIPTEDFDLIDARLRQTLRQVRAEDR